MKKIRDLCKTSSFAQSLRQAHPPEADSKILKVFLRLHEVKHSAISSPSLTLNKIERFAKVSILLFTLVSVMLWAEGASAKRLSVSVDKANIRSDPGTNHEILWSAGKYYPVDIINRSGEWYQIRDFEDDTGWIHQSLLEKTPAVIVTGTIVNIREGPGTSFAILFQAEKGVSFKLLERRGKWLKVRHGDGDVGWIHQSLVWGY